MIKWVNEIKLRTPKHSWFSVCLLQRHCSSAGVLPVCADNCNIFCRLVYFISFPSLLPPSRTPHTQRACAPGQDSGQCAQLSFRVASESAGCDFRLARVIIILSYMGIIRSAIISQHSQYPCFFSKQLVNTFWPSWGFFNDRPPLEWVSE